MIDNNGTIPEKQSKPPTWTRWLDVVLRTAHVLVISVLLGGAVFKIPASRLLHWQYFSLATGCALIVSEVLHSRHWPYQGRGLMVFLHVGLFTLAGFRPGLALPLLLAALILGMLGSHMPKKLRHWSFLHGRVED